MNKNGTSAHVATLRLRSLFDAVMDVGSQPGLVSVLRSITEMATDLVGAQYGALGVLDATGARLEQFITVGIDDVQVERISAHPEGHGILGLLVLSPQPLRLRNVKAHADSFGFPPNHPSMSSFLGVPVHLAHQVFGNLYFADKVIGDCFNDIDEALAVALAALAAIAIQNVRLNEDAVADVRL